MLEVYLKFCSKCGTLKPPSEFYKCKSNTDGLYGRCRDCERNRYRERRSSEEKINMMRESKRRYAAKRKYGFSKDEYDLLVQKYIYCPICKKEFFGSVPHVDHCHSTGFVRGLLCSNCNFLLGHAKDSIPTLLKMIDYLSNSK